MNNTFSDHSRVWIYMSNRPFTDIEVSDIEMALIRFCKEWTAHGSNLSAKGEVRFNRFIILMVDEIQAGASGCSIDKSVHFIKEIEEEYNVQLFDRLLIAWMQDDEVKTTPFSEIEKLLEDGAISENTLVFNNAITTKKDLDQRWTIPLKESWMASRIVSKP